MKIIVTSPHRTCRDKNNRDCDTISGLASDIISKRLNAVEIRGNEHRKDNDLNRSWTRDTKFRVSLDNALKKYSGDAIILDIHSFPNYYGEEAGDINFFKKDQIPPDLVLMVGDNDKYKGISISYEIFSCLKDIYNVKIISDVPVLDILNQSNEYDIPGVLIEFNEKYKNSPKELNILCDKICNCLCFLEKSMAKTIHSIIK